jgi:hypothetical protein
MRANGKDHPDTLTPPGGEAADNNTHRTGEQQDRANALLDLIRQQVLAAQKAGPRQVVIEPLSESELDKPLMDGASLTPMEEPAPGAPRPIPVAQGYRITQEISRGGG